MEVISLQLTPTILKKNCSLDCQCENYNITKDKISESNRYHIKRRYSVCDICSESDFLRKSTSSTGSNFNISDSSSFSDE